MIPIGDDIPTRTFPFVTIALIVANVAVFSYELSLGSGAQSFIGTHGIVPKQAVLLLAQMNLSGLSDRLLSSLFIHAGWLHLAGNMLFLWVFGTNVEDKFGHFKYTVFYLGVGFLAMTGHIWSMPGSVDPAIGASGAIAGVLGAYSVMFPRARVFIVIPLFLFFPVVAIRAVYVLGFWFVQQLINGFGAIVAPSAAAGVAWWAHIAGFAAGMIFARLYLWSSGSGVRVR